VIGLKRGARVRVELKGVRPKAVYFDGIFNLDDNEIMLLIAIDRFLRLPGNPTTIVEHSRLRP
jgi:hypothetical protein